MNKVQDIDTSLNIKLSAEQVERISKILIQQPYNVVADIIETLQTQGEAEQARISEEVKKTLVKESKKESKKD